MSEENKEVYRRFVEEVLNQKNLDLLFELLDTNFVWHGGSQTVHGPLGMKQMITGFLAGLPDLHLNIDDIMDQGDKVAMRWTAKATHTGDLMGTAPTNKSVMFTGVAMGRFSGGRLAEEWESLDELGLLRQLGIVPEAQSS